MMNDQTNIEHFVAQGGFLDIMCKLLSSGINFRDKEGSTPLHYMASVDKVEDHSEWVIKLLLESRANVGTKGRRHFNRRPSANAQSRSTYLWRSELTREPRTHTWSPPANMLLRNIFTYYT